MHGFEAKKVSGAGRVDATIGQSLNRFALFRWNDKETSQYGSGSALDIFGGKLPYQEALNAGVFR